MRLCQALGPAAPFPIWAVDGAAQAELGEVGWDARGCVDWQWFAQGEYVGHPRTPHVPEYRLRPDDTLSIYYLRTREIQPDAYKLQVGDSIRIESLTTENANRNDVPEESGSLNREAIVQPDGTVTLPLVGRVPVARRTVEAVRNDLERRFREYLREPAITVTPLLVNTRLEDLLDAVDARDSQVGGRRLTVVVTPSGRIQLPGAGSVYVHGFTLAEAKREIDARYASAYPGVSTTVDLVSRAQRFIYVVGEVQTPGRFDLVGPTTVMQAIALAGGWNIGGNLRQVVIFRRGPDWRLMATMVDLAGALNARRPVPADEIWLNDSDIVLIPKSRIQALDEFIEQVFTRGLYAAIPLEIIWGQGFATVSAIISTN